MKSLKKTIEIFLFGQAIFLSINSVAFWIMLDFWNPYRMIFDIPYFNPGQRALFTICAILFYVANTQVYVLLTEKDSDGIRVVFAVICYFFVAAFMPLIYCNC